MSKRFRFQAFGHVDEDVLRFELLDGEDILLEMRAGKDGVAQVDFHQSALDRVIPAEQLIELLREGCRLVADDWKDSR